MSSPLRSQSNFGYVPMWQVHYIARLFGKVVCFSKGNSLNETCSGLVTDSTALLSDKFHFYFIYKSEIISQLLLASITSNAVNGQRSNNTFNECLQVSAVHNPAARIQLCFLINMRWQVYHIVVKCL